jgi:hypothetical protein
MDLLELFYVALGTIGIMIVLHLGTFGISRMMKPTPPKIVYVQAPPAPVQAPPPVAPQQPLSQPPPSIQLPTYDVAPQRNIEQAAPAVPSLPPPIETRSTTKQGGGDMGMPR